MIPLVIILLSSTAYAECMNSISLIGQPKYQPNQIRGYVDSHARRGGTFRLTQTGTFNHFNPMTRKGVRAAGISLVYESLLTASVDDKYTAYGLLADKVCVDGDQYVTWHINPRARWHDGREVTAMDVMLTFKKAQESDVIYLAKITKEILSMKVLNKHTIQMKLTSTKPTLLHSIGAIDILPSDFRVSENSKNVIGSGPYRLSQFQVGRDIEYTRDPNYWANHLAVNQYRYNFDKVQYQYFLSDNTAFMAFLSGRADYWLESISKRWQQKYREGDDQHWVRSCYPSNDEVQTQGFVMNMRRPIFDDPVFRFVLVNAMDFEWLNKTMFYGQYKAVNSLFTHTPYAASPSLSDQEQRIMSELPNPIQPKAMEQQHLTKSQLRGLLKKAGYTWQGKQLITPAGQPVVLFLPYVDASLERVLIAYRAMLADLGIRLEIQLLSEPDLIHAQKNHKYDLLWTAFVHDVVPDRELYMQFHSSQSELPGLMNNSGLRHANVDALVEQIMSVKPDERVAYLKVLDRVIMHENIIVPHWYIKCSRIAYNRNITQPTGEYAADDIWSWYY